MKGIVFLTVLLALVLIVLLWSSAQGQVLCPPEAEVCAPVAFEMYMPVVMK